MPDIRPVNLATDWPERDMVITRGVTVLKCSCSLFINSSLNVTVCIFNKYFSSLVVDYKSIIF